MKRGTLPSRRLQQILVCFCFASAVELGAWADAASTDGEEQIESEADVVVTDQVAREDIEFEASSRISPEGTAFPVGEKFDVYLEMEARGTTAGAEMGSIPEIKVSDNLRVLKTASGNLSRSIKGSVTSAYYYRYTLEGLREGEGKVRSAELEYRLPGEDNYRTLRTPEISVTIVAAAAGGPALWQKLAVAVGIPVVACAGLVVVLLSRSRRRTRDELAEQAEPEWIQRLEEAQRKRYEGDPRGYLDALFEVLRGGVGEGLGLEGLPATLVLKERLAEVEWDAEVREECLALLGECEVIRYAPEVPPLEDLDRMAKRIREVLERT